MRAEISLATTKALYADAAQFRTRGTFADATRP